MLLAALDQGEDDAPTRLHEDGKAEVPGRSLFRFLLRAEAVRLFSVTSLVAGVTGGALVARHARLMMASKRDTEPTGPSAKGNCGWGVQVGARPGGGPTI